MEKKSGQEYEFDWSFFILLSIALLWLISIFVFLYAGSLIGVLIAIVSLFILVIVMFTKPRK